MELVGGVDLGEEHREHPVGEAGPPIAAGIVGGLLVGEAGDERREQVDVPLCGDARRRELRAHELVELDRDRIRVRRGLEARDLALKHQDVAHDVLGHELEEHAGEIDNCFADVLGGRERLRAFDQRAVAGLEHGVVQRVLRLEVRVERGLTQVDQVGELAERDAAQSVAVGQRPGRGEDLLPLRLASPCSSIYH